MASQPEQIVENPEVILKNPPPPPPKPILCGGPTEARTLGNDDNALFQEYQEFIEPKIREQFNVPADFPLKPTKVRTQVVAGTNYIFHVPLPTGQFAHVKVFKPLKCHAALQGNNPAELVTVDPEAKSE